MERINEWLVSSVDPLAQSVDGTGNRWAGMSTATANTGRVASTGINDTLTNVDVDLNNGADDAANKYEAAGVIWSSQTN